mmetsp:Transcript_15923/g.50037  ORF Transcript_15923/g.50037 Transcript_15923/m.50037 type:complete len:333 (+) Transcript_15923:125-1123(+)
MNDHALGYLAVLGSVIFFGSFGVPIKSPAIVAAKVDPVVFQCYKTLACFSTCWLVLLYVPYKFTWWGTVGASIWVVNGICAIIAVQKAGLGISQSLWSGLSIFVSFVWGAVIFGEPIRDMPMALLSLGVMAVGMAGIGTAASRKKAPPGAAVDLEDVTLIQDEDGNGNGKYGSKMSNQFVTGLGCALYVGIANGSFMVPLKYGMKNTDVKGIEYLVSFGVGAGIVTIVVAGIYFAGLRHLGRPIPSFQVGVAAKPALTTGLLWSAGNYCSIYATNLLGMAIGWPLVQCQLIVSGLWGVLYYREVEGRRTIGLFMASSAVLLMGVVLLSQYGM